MATRYFCDGCDQEVGSNRNFVVNITTITGALNDLRDQKWSVLDGKSYHLCEHCEVRLKDQANPSGWPRMAMSA